MKVTIIAIVIGAFGTVTKGLLKGLEDLEFGSRVETIQISNNNNNNMHIPAPILENDSHKPLWDFNIQMDQLIPARTPDLIIINKNKRICKIVDFAIPADHRINLKESEKKDKYLDLARES